MLVPHYANHFPGAVMVSMLELADALASPERTSSLPNGNRAPVTPEFLLAWWNRELAERNGVALDVYIRQRTSGKFVAGIRYGNAPSEYTPLYIYPECATKVEALFQKKKLTTPS